MKEKTGWTLLKKMGLVARDGCCCAGWTVATFKGGGGGNNKDRADLKTATQEIESSKST